METLNVALGDRSYPIHIGSGDYSANRIVATPPSSAEGRCRNKRRDCSSFVERVSRRLRDEGVEVVQIVLPRAIQRLENAEYDF